MQLSRQGANVRGYPSLEVKVWGDLACYTRPEAKVERVSYEVMTPSAARWVLHSIFWKPEIRWEVREIRVLKPIQYLASMRNEVKGSTSEAMMNERTMQRWIREGGNYYINDDRTQRHTLALRDVAYIIVADIVLTNPIAPEGTEALVKYRDQFRRRVSRGQCFQRPYLGIREFAAYFGDVEPDDHPLPLEKDLGYLLFDFLKDPQKQERGKPYFFAATLTRGVLVVPKELYQLVNGGTRDVVTATR